MGLRVEIETAALPICSAAVAALVQGAGCVYRHSLTFLTAPLGHRHAHRARNRPAKCESGARKRASERMKMYCERLTARVTAGLNPRVRGRGVTENAKFYKPSHEAKEESLGGVERKDKKDVKDIRYR